MASPTHHAAHRLATIVAIVMSTTLQPTIAVAAQLRTVALTGQPVPGTDNGVTFKTFDAHIVDGPPIPLFRGPVLNDAARSHFGPTSLEAESIRPTVLASGPKVRATCHWWPAPGAQPLAAGPSARFPAPSCFHRCSTMPARPLSTAPSPTAMWVFGQRAPAAWHSLPARASPRRVHPVARAFGSPVVAASRLS